MTKKELNKIIGKNIKKYRLLYNKKNNSNLTQERLAEMIDVSVSLISNIESLKSYSGISIPVLYKISIVLDTPINLFFEDNNEKWHLYKK